MLDVIGAGFGRTGTLSLKYALEKLGFVKCYHMAEVVANPRHVKLWQAAWRGAEPWDELFKGYAAAVDWPTVAFWPRLTERYPEATVVLTVRDAHSWFRSATDTIFRSMREGATDDPTRRERMVMLREIIIDGTFHGDLDNEASVTAVYDANVARVRAQLPPERLVLFDLREGWEPLCRGLHLPVPNEPFPHVNTSEEFFERWRGGEPHRTIVR